MNPRATARSATVSESSRQDSTSSCGTSSVGRYVDVAGEAIPSPSAQVRSRVPVSVVSERFDRAPRTLPSLGPDTGTSRCACLARRQSRLVIFPRRRLCWRHDNERKPKQRSQEDLTGGAPAADYKVARTRGSCAQPASALPERHPSVTPPHAGGG